MTIETFILEAILIFALILANGFFSGSEIAIITSRKSRVKTLVEEKKRGAVDLLDLKDDPEKFLSTIQIGITIVGSLASAVGGAAAVHILPNLVKKVPIEFIAGSAEAVSIMIVVTVISYFSLVLGELFPKSLAIRHSEKIALFVAGPIRFFSKATYPAVRLLTASNHVILRLMGLSKKIDSSFITEEEILQILKEGEEKGVIDETEHELIHSIFDFADRHVKEVMVPHPNVQAVNIEWNKGDILKFIVEKGFTRYPVYENTLDNIVGVLNSKEVLSRMVNKKPFKIRDIMLEPFFVPEFKAVSDLLKEMQKKRMHLALVVDEYGAIAGLVTMEDLFEEIVGEIEDESKVGVGNMVKKLKDGTMIIDGSTSIRDLINIWGVTLTDSEAYETIAGMILSRLQAMPKGGEMIHQGGYKFTILEVERNRIVKVRAEREEISAVLKTKKTVK
ncbi:MAG: HlyC/CorC family transporter [Deltaproteobacteria bacterium]|nr:HlyC/CorC family transporter [Candidatus Zymogenaceae bacterium]